MAARRLLILLLAVVAISTFGAALIAPRPEPGPATTTTTTQEHEGVAPGRSAPGRLIEASVHTDARRADSIRLRPGDQLELTVRSRIAGQVEIPRFGLLENVGPNRPARFSLLLNEAADFEVRLAGSGRTVARIEVSAPHRGQPATRREADRSDG